MRDMKLQEDVISGLGDKKLSTNLKSEESTKSDAKKEPYVGTSLHNVTDKFTSYQELVSEFVICASLCHECIIEKTTLEKKASLKMDEKEEEQQEESTYQGSSPDEVAICRSMKKIGSEYLGSKFGISRLNFFGDEKKYQIKMVIVI